MKVTAIAQPSGDWWAIEVPEIPGLFTQAKRLDQVEAMVKDAAELMGVESIDVELKVQLAAEVEAEVTAAKQAAARAFALQTQAAARSRMVASHLRRQGMSVRDVAVIMGISPQRVSQLVPQRHESGAGVYVVPAESPEQNPRYVAALIDDEVAKMVTEPEDSSSRSGSGSF